MEHYCHRCGHNMPVRLSKAGPPRGERDYMHEKASCGYCGAYIKFGWELPDYEASKLKAWELTKDLTLIEAAKKEVFRNYTDKEGRNIDYHNLYSHIVKNHFS